MGQKFGKGVVHRSGVSEQCTPSTDWERDEGELFWTWRAIPPRASHVRNNSPANRASAENDLFWSLGSNKDQDESCEAEDKEVDLFWTWRTTLDEERPPVTDVTLVSVSVAAEDEMSGQGFIPEILENPETLDGGPEILTSQDPLPDMENPVFSDSQMQFGLDLDSGDVQNPGPNEADGGAEIQQSQSVGQSEEKLEDEEISGVIFQEINSSMYKVGELLAVDSSVSVYEGTRVQDDLKVLVKYINTMERVDYIFIPGYPAPLPRQVGLHLLACQGDVVHEILQLVDWQEFPDRLVMVLERPSPCEGLDEFLASKGGELDELSAKEIMWQATWAAHMCCKRGVFHRDIKLKNFFIKADTLDLKLDNFGCGELLHKSAYKTFTGTRDYFCPEFFRTGEYYGKPATVYSLGVLLFAMLRGKFPDCNDRNSIWSKDGLTEECCSLLEDCLQEDPDRRIRLKNIFKHKWFQVKDPVDGLQTPVRSENKDLILYRELMSKVELEENNPGVDVQEINRNQYEIGKMLGEGGFGKVYEGTRVQDGLKVAVKIVWKNEYVINDYIDIPGYPVLLPREVGLQMLACEGTYVPSIIQLLDWEDRLDHYVMVLERPSPCEDVLSFMNHSGGKLDENTAQVILGQATEAAEICCMRGVFHRDIKVENILINPNTMEVKLIDFGCGALFKNSDYTDFMGTDVYLCPEFFLTGEYYAKPATVYSLGVLLFVMLCGKFPRIDDLDQIHERRWCKEGLTIECCRLVEDCLQRNPEKRIQLEEIFEHKWFKQALGM
ncbi:uncharacterized protein LOC130433469 isoform X2 [Triplophysa dalaica]|uniref:uncharacterized protein LOC130433469 isoform X2 n=1 Tax=Triplophysa dalaica TaxID=1582913 RepID=UPI0024DFF18F|nr:uncharacterized protein LOC130433469 isoform X2 [Triplophysa dalaica]